MNKVILIGRLTKDPELRYTASNVANCMFTIAVDRRYKTENGPTADFIPVVAWRQTAEFISKYFSKGSKIAITGSIQTRSWDDSEGKRRYVTEVIIDDAEFVDSKRQDSGYSQAPMPEEPRAQKSAAPKAEGQAQKQSTGANSSDSSAYFALDDEDGFPF